MTGLAGLGLVWQVGARIGVANGQGMARSGAAR